MDTWLEMLGRMRSGEKLTIDTIHQYAGHLKLIPDPILGPAWKTFLIDEKDEVKDDRTRTVDLFRE